MANLDILALRNLPQDLLFRGLFSMTQNGIEIFFNYYCSLKETEEYLITKEVKSFGHSFKFANGTPNL